MLDFKFTSEQAYIKELVLLLTTNVKEEESYNDLMDEFMYFCEVSGSG